MLKRQPEEKKTEKKRPVLTQEKITELLEKGEKDAEKLAEHLESMSRIDPKDLRMRLR